MALRQVMFSVRHQVHKMVLSARPYSSEADINSSRVDQRNQYDEEGNLQETDYKVRGAEGINDVYLTGVVFGEVFPTQTGNGVTFLVDIFHNGKYGPYKVRTKVVAIGSALPAQGAEALKEGQKVFVRGRLGSKVERSQDGASIVRNNHVVGKFITLI